MKTKNQRTYTTCCVLCSSQNENNSGKTGLTHSSQSSTTDTNSESKPWFFEKLFSKNESTPINNNTNTNETAFNKKYDAGKHFDVKYDSIKNFNRPSDGYAVTKIDKTGRKIR